MDLKQMAGKKGIEYIDRGNGHIQLVGQLLVNYYPESKRRSAYVAGTTKKVVNVTPEQALSMCFSQPERVAIKRKRKSTRKLRLKMLAKSSKCCWCEKDLTLDNSTIEHVIPISRGGLDNANNRKLACPECNRDRGNEMTELTGCPTAH